ncbi:MAG: hypothetical protein K9L59_05500 [Desulfobacterales bacterium]|nr:hypothetical protein [Desulfobacterales bacterium]
MSKVYDQLRQGFAGRCRERGLLDEQITIRARALDTEEAIGHPEGDDFPLQKGRERLMQAEFQGARGQAFTDRYGDFSGRLSQVLEMDLANNYRRAIFVATLNAVLRHLGAVEGTVHCRDREPGICARQVASHLRETRGAVRVTQIGFQPKLIEMIQQGREFRVVDLDPDNIGIVKAGVTVEGPESTADAVSWADLLLVTGTTLVNNTIDAFLDQKPVLFYGTTIAGAGALMNWDRICPCSH